MTTDNVKRFVLANPSNFKIIGFLVGTPRINILTGEQSHAINCRIGSPSRPVDITPFLENVKVIVA